MERLTRRSENGIAIYNTPSGEPVKWENNRHKVLQKLAEYEDFEEQGKLLKLPCAVGDTVYKIYPNDLTDRVLGLTVVAFSNKAMELYGDTWTSFDKIGKTVFLTREEAEAALKELEEGKYEI